MLAQKTTGIRWLTRSQQTLQKLASWLQAIQSAIFMGCVEDASFQAFDTYPFDESEPLDVAVHADQGLEPWERQIVRAHLADVNSILVVAAGGARELVGLNELGYATAGVEYGTELCEASRRELTLRNSTATIERGERFEVPGEDESYDAAKV